MTVTGNRGKRDSIIISVLFPQQTCFFLLHLIWKVSYFFCCNLGAKQPVPKPVKTRLKVWLVWVFLNLKKVLFYTSPALHFRPQELSASYSDRKTSVKLLSHLHEPPLVRTSPLLLSVKHRLSSRSRAALRSEGRGMLLAEVPGESLLEQNLITCFVTFTAAVSQQRLNLTNTPGKLTFPLVTDTAASRNSH